MAFTPGFKHDLFVSYAHFDNEADSQEIRWVSRFQADLRSTLRQRLGEDPAVFFDTRDFEAQDHVDLLLDNARRSAVFLAILSPSYVAREFTIRELQAFGERSAHGGRIITVELLPIERERDHPLLSGLKRTPFWWKDKTEQDVPLRLSPKFNSEMYNERLQVLAHQLKKLLTEIRAAGPPAAEAVANAAGEPAVPRTAAAGRAVLLAQATDDLYDECQKVRAHLEQFGATVLPENDYPQGGAAFAQAFEADVAQSALFVQLLGNFPSRKPPDLPQTYSQYQYETAKARGLKVLQWRRPDLDLAAVTHRDKPLLEAPDVRAVGLEEFKAEMLRRWSEQSKPPPQPVAEGDCHVFINADKSDKELADALLTLFEGRKDCTAARPLFEGSAKEITEDLENNLLNCGIFLLLYGQASPAWVRAQLLRYSKLEKQRTEPVRRKAIVLGPPEQKAEIAWSGGFTLLDARDGEIARLMRHMFDGARA